ACAQIIMSEDRASIGNVLAAQSGGLDEPERAAYAEAARAYPSPDLIFKMIDPDPVVKVLTRDRPRYLAPKPLAARQTGGNRLDPDPKQPPELAAGNFVFTARQARALGLCQDLCNTRQDVARSLGLPPRSLREDWLSGRTPVARRIEVRGTINKGKLDSLERRIKSVLARDKANVIILQLECQGGETRDVASTAEVLSTLKDDVTALRTS